MKCASPPAPVRVVGLALLALSSACACSKTADSTSTAAELEGDAAPPEPAAPQLGHARVWAPGRPHLGIVNMVALAPEGGAALSADSLGEVRWWADVDAPLPPQAVPVRGPNAMAIAGDEDGRVFMAFVDAAGGAKIFTASPKSPEPELRFELPPTEPLNSVHPIRWAGAAKGEARFVFAALTRDRSVRLFDEAGAPLDAWTGRGFPAESLQVQSTPTGPRLLVKARVVRNDGALTLFQELGLRENEGDAGPSLEALGDPSELVGTATELQVDATRRAIWVLRRESEAGRIELSRTPMRGAAPEQGAMSKVIEMNFVGGTRLGLDAKGKPVLEVPNTGVFVFDPKSEQTHGTPMRVDGIVGTHWVSGRRVGGFSTFLAVEAPGGDSRFLGYRSTQGSFSALSPDGARVAWVGAHELSIVPVGEGEARAFDLGTEVAPMGVSWVDEDRIVIGQWDGRMALLSAKDGSVLDELDAGGLLSDWRVASNAKAIVWRTQSWGSRHLVGFDQDGFSAPRSILDAGSTYGPWFDAQGDLGLWSFDGSRLQLRDAKEIAAGLESRDPSEGLTPPAGGTSSFLGMVGDLEVWSGLTGSPARGKILVRDRKGETRFTARLGNSFPAWMDPSPDGKTMAVATDLGVGPRSLTMLSMSEGKELWSRAIPQAASVSWTAEGGQLWLHVPQGGALAIDAASGETLHARCGFEFEVRTTPPINHGGAIADVCGEL